MRFFDLSEFACPCCGNVAMRAGFLGMIDQARGYSDFPFIVNSGYRCEAHNKSVGGSPTSSHLLGLAADIKAENSTIRLYVVRGLIKAGFTRVGINFERGFVHVDADQGKTSALWGY